MFAIEQLKGKSRKRNGFARPSISLYDLKMGRYGVVVDNELEFGAIGDLLGGDSPVSCSFEAFGNSVLNLVNGVSCAVIGDGATGTVGTFSFSKP